MNNKRDEIDRFLNDLDEIIYKNSEKYNKDKRYFWTETKINHVPYKNNKEIIYVSSNDGTIKGIEKFVDGLDLKTEKIYTTINLEILLGIIESKKQKDVKLQIDRLIKTYSNRNHIEIEKKFILKNIEFEKILALIKEYDMNIGKIFEKNQHDTYYDDKNRFLFNEDITFRIRSKEDKLYATIKTPTSDLQNSERFEHEFEVDSYDIDKVVSRMDGYIDKAIIDKIKQCSKVLMIKNNRKVVYIEKNDVNYEIAYDNITYIDTNGNEVGTENELEIELKSNYYHRVHLKLLSDHLCKKIDNLTVNKKSKYRRGMEIIDKYKCKA